MAGVSDDDTAAQEPLWKHRQRGGDGFTPAPTLACQHENKSGFGASVLGSAQRRSRDAGSVR